MKRKVSRAAIVARIRRKMEPGENIVKMTDREVSSMQAEHGDYFHLYNNNVQDYGGLEKFAEIFKVLAAHEEIEAA